MRGNRVVSLSQINSICELELSFDNRDLDDELVAVAVSLALCPISDSLSESVSGMVTGFLVFDLNSYCLSRNSSNRSFDSLKPFSSK